MNKDSIIKTDAIYKLKGDNIVKYIGKIDQKTLEKMNKEYLKENKGGSKHE